MPSTKDNANRKIFETMPDGHVVVKLRAQCQCSQPDTQAQLKKKD